MRDKNKRITAFKSQNQISYLIITNGEKTEINYFKGLIDSLDEDLRNKIIVKYCHTDIKNFINKAIEIVSKQPQISKVWLMFDIDREKNHIKTLVNRAKSKGYYLAFSNPCIEIWFLAYFTSMPDYKDNNYLPASHQCINDLKNYIKNYQKSDDNIYQTLIMHGNEKHAVNIAHEKYNKYNTKTLLEMFGCSSVYKLVSEIKNMNL